MWFPAEKSICSAHFSPLMTETSRRGWRRNTEWFLVRWEDLWSAHTVLQSARWRDESSEILHLWTMFTVLEMAGRDGGSTVCALFTTCDYMKWRGGRCDGGGEKRWMIAKGQELLSNSRSAPARQIADIRLMWMWLCVAVWVSVPGGCWIEALEVSVQLEWL